MRRLRAWVSALCVLLLAGEAWGASEAWRERFEAGREALKAQRFGEALAAFEGCLDLAEDEPERWNALVALGLSHELMGEPIEALGRYWSFVEQAEAAERGGEAFWERKLREVEESVSRLEGSVLETRARVRFALAPGDARASLDGAAVDGARYYYVTPGRYELEVEREGFQPESERFTVAAGDVRVVSVALEPLPQAPEPVEPDPLPGPGVGIGAPQADPPTRTAEWVLLGGGGAALLTGAVLTGLTAADVDEMEELSARPGTSESVARYRELEDRARSTQTASWIAYGAGAVAIAVGIILWVSEGEPSGDGVVVRF